MASKSARSLMAASSKLRSTISIRSAGRPANARRLPTIQYPLQLWFDNAQYFCTSYSLPVAAPGRQSHAGRRQQFDTAGAKLRQHLGIAAELAVGENRNVQPAGRLRADRLRRLRQSKREGVGIRRIDAKLELELGRGAGRLAQRRRCPGRRSEPKQTPAGHFSLSLPPGRVSPLGGSFRRTGVIRKVR